MRFPVPRKDDQLNGFTNLFIILRNSLWTKWIKICNKSHTATWPTRRCPLKRSQLNSRAKGNASTSWQETASATCRPTVSLSILHVFNPISYRQRHDLFPQRYIGTKEGVSSQRPSEEHPRASIQEPQYREGPHFCIHKAWHWRLPTRRAGPPEGAQAMDYEHMQRSNWLGLQRLGCCTGRREERHHGRKERDHDLYGSRHGRQVRS